ncbi:uncharacterized protein LOC143235803 [Tachypleus tridentatus]|uniref:uncharacterized protein LOC143235803 n=1 Tax=Tachypleus tridentatus TaxID=6853 RepID=UPI003FCF5A1B
MISELYCPMMWDGAICWPYIPAGTLYEIPCPAYVHGFNTDAVASKLCTSDGTWWINKDRNQTWTNYSMCVAHNVDLQGEPEGPGISMYIDGSFESHLLTIKLISKIGYTVSFSALIVAFLILAFLRKLRCPRNNLHMHLFISFLMRALMFILKDAMFVAGMGFRSNVAMSESGVPTFLESRSNIDCKVFTSFWHYFLMANYCWILMEGLYLHNLVFLAMFTDTSGISLYVIMGWELYCPMMWDGAICWPYIPAGTLYEIPCPAYVHGFNTDAVASKLCTSDGTWWINKDRNQTWTNYSMCVAHNVDLQGEPEGPGISMYIDGSFESHLLTIKLISKIGYTVSFSALIVAFLILAFLRKLRCPRNNLHMHLFISFLMRALMFILKDAMFVAGMGFRSNVAMSESGVPTFLESRSNIDCKVFTSFWHYFLMANYCWILMEGLYLHNLVFLAMFTDTSGISLYVIMGWANNYNDLYHVSYLTTIKTSVIQDILQSDAFTGKKKKREIASELQRNEMGTGSTDSTDNIF